MPNPQQPELRRSGKVPALDPDATEAKRSADQRPDTSDTRAPIPDDQRPGHHPEHDEDKPDLDAFAERLGVVPEGDEPEGAPSVETRPDQTRTERTQPDSAQQDRVEKARGLLQSLPGAKLVLLGPAVGYVVVRRIVRIVRNR